MLQRCAIRSHCDGVLTAVQLVGAAPFPILCVRQAVRRSKTLLLFHR